MTKSFPLPSLSDRQSDFTRKLILDTAIEALEADPTRNLTMRLIAKRAAIAERTVFRYFATRDELLDGVADDFRARLNLPPTPRTVEDLLLYPRALYTRFEASASLNKAALQSEIAPRLQASAGKSRFMALRK